MRVLTVVRKLGAGGTERAAQNGSLALAAEERIAAIAVIGTPLHLKAPIPQLVGVVKHFWRDAPVLAHMFDVEAASPRNRPGSR